MKFLHRLEPLFWLLFGSGGFAAAFVLPPLVFGLLIAGPMGWFPADAFEYHRMHGLAANPVGRIVILGVVTLVLWHSAHHLRHFLLDVGLARLHTPLAYLLYGLAGVASAACLGAVSSL